MLLTVKVLCLMFASYIIYPLIPIISLIPCFSLFGFSFLLALDENEKTHASAHTTTTITTTSNQSKKVTFPKSTYGRPTLYSQKIVIGSDELIGKNINNVVREKIDSLEKSPKVVRSTALIIKTSKTPVKPSNATNNAKTGNITEIKTYTTTIGGTESISSIEPLKVETQSTNANQVDLQQQVSSIVSGPDVSKSSSKLKDDIQDLTKPSINGNPASARSITRPVAFALAIASAAAAAVSSNVRGNGITIDDTKNGHDTGES